MRKILLCETKTAGKPYYFSPFHQWVESYEEVCDIISRRMIYFFVYGVPDDLKIWLRQEYRLHIKSTDIKKQLFEVLEFKSFFTPDEKRVLAEQIRNLYLQSPSKKYWMLGENFRKNQQYLSAFSAYEKVLIGIGQFAKDDQINIYYNMGICLCQMFQFENAKEYLKKGLEIESNVKCQKALDTILFLSVNQEVFIQEVLESGRTREDATEIYEKFQLQKEQIQKEHTFTKLNKIEYHKKKLDDTVQNRLTKSMLEQWKNEYKREIS